MEGGLLQFPSGSFLRKLQKQHIRHATGKTAAQQGVLPAAPSLPKIWPSDPFFVIVCWRLDSLLLFSAIFPPEPVSYQTLEEKRGLLMNEIHQSSKTTKRIQILEQTAGDTDEKLIPLNI